MSDIASYIDHTLLKPEASREDILRCLRGSGEVRFRLRLREPDLTALVHNKLKGSA